MLPNKIFTERKKMGVPEEVQANRFFCNHYSKEQNLCCRAALFLRARLVFQVPHHLVFLKTAGPQANSQSSEHTSSHGCDILSRSLCPCPSPLGSEPQHPLQPKKTQNLTQASALKSLFSESQNLGKGQREEVTLEYSEYLLHFQDGRCKMQENYLL